MNKNKPLWQTAASLAARFHDQHYRRDGETPYFAHPVRVAITLHQVFGLEGDELVAAALLHDALEDTNADYDDVLKACGVEVADIVAAMTKDMRMVEHRREPAYDRQLAKASWKARAVKLADVYDNLTDTNPGRAAKILDRARRALELAKNDPQLRLASKKLKKLVEQKRREHGH